MKYGALLYTFSTSNMAKVDGKGEKDDYPGLHGVDKLQHAGEKRRSGERVDVDQEPQPKKPMSFSFSAKSSKPSAPGMGLTASSASSLPKFIPKKPAAPIKMSLGAQKPKTSEPPIVKKTSTAVSQAFNEDSDSEEEEMPPEAKMRMRNIGRETPTAAGPNSYGKNKLGFCDRQRLYQKELEKQMDEVGES